jgi:ribosomal protein L22
MKAEENHMRLSGRKANKVCHKLEGNHEARAESAESEREESESKT